jgi:hypothetical protein
VFSAHCLQTGAAGAFPDRQFFPGLDWCQHPGESAPYVTLVKFFVA